MEFRVTNRLTGAKQAAGPAKKTGTAAVVSQRNEARLDKLALSQQAVKLLEERTRQEAQERAKKAKERMAGKKEESGSSPLDAAVKKLKVMQQCQKIASRIMAGDKVPPEDEKFLMENDMAGYQLAMASRKPKEDPEEWDSVLEDEQEKSQASSCPSESGGGSSETADAAAGDCTAAE